MEKYAMYLRKSRADLDLEALGEGETLARHQKMLFDLAARHDISTDQIVIYKEVVSGDSIQERPEMQRLLRDIYAKRFKAVLVVEIERLARGNTKDQGEVADAFQYSNTHIITPSKVYDPNNEFDQEYFEFGLFMSRREFKTIRRRLEAGKTQSAMEGNYLSPKRLFGYKIVRLSKKDRTLEIIPEEEKLVHMIFDWYEKDGWSTWKIANELTQMGITTTSGKKEWNRGSIREMLRNQHYTGMVIWNTHRTVKEYDPKTGKTVKKRVPVPREEWIYVKGKHEGIISQEQFDRVQQMVEFKNPVNSDFELKNPFAGLLFCCDCGKSLSYNMQKKWKTDEDRPWMVHPYWGRCKKKSVRFDILVDAVVDALKAYIADFEMKMESGNDQTELILHQERIQAMEKELSKLEAKKRRLFDSWEADDGTYTRDEFIERKQMYTQQIDALKAKIEEEKRSAPLPVDYAEQITTLHQMINCIKDDSISVLDKNAFLKRFIERIDYDSIDLGWKKGVKVVLDIHLK